MSFQVKKIIIDTDPGVDDAIAILMALGAPSLRVLGLTTVGGNVPLARATRNALALLEYAQRTDIPVARGSALPIRGQYGYAFPVHGSPSDRCSEQTVGLRSSSREIGESRPFPHRFAANIVYI